jgi:undecaprenyl-diphosphatase
LEGYAVTIAGLTQWLSAHQDLGYLAVFMFSFAESLAFVSIAFPGTVLLIAAGFLAFHGAFSPTWLILIASLGAFLGDTLSFFVGKRSSGLLKKIRVHPETFEKGRRFVQKHGLWALVIGKFIGPLRCIVPLLSGMFHMRAAAFFVVELASALLWATTLTFTGYFFYRSYEAFQAYLSLSAVLGLVSSTIVGLVIFLIRRGRSVKKASQERMPF